jgi:hypothetical protein
MQSCLPSSQLASSKKSRQCGEANAKISGHHVLELVGELFRPCDQILHLYKKNTTNLERSKSDIMKDMNSASGSRRYQALSATLQTNTSVSMAMTRSDYRLENRETWSAGDFTCPNELFGLSHDMKPVTKVLLTMTSCDQLRRDFWWQLTEEKPVPGSVRVAACREFLEVKFILLLDI